ncbi:hypothetical protein DCC79_09205 [bacterium]|nr:MAG: hypothetical protein DCC79_09205 [bacterium]
MPPSAAARSAVHAAPDIGRRRTSSTEIHSPADGPVGGAIGDVGAAVGGGADGDATVGTGVGGGSVGPPTVVGVGTAAASHVTSTRPDDWCAMRSVPPGQPRRAPSPSASGIVVDLGSPPAGVAEGGRLVASAKPPAGGDPGEAWATAAGAPPRATSIVAWPAATAGDSQATTTASRNGPTEGRG